MHWLLSNSLALTEVYHRHSTLLQIRLQNRVNNSPCEGGEVDVRFGRIREASVSISTELSSIMSSLALKGDFRILTENRAELQRKRSVCFVEVSWSFGRRSNPNREKECVWLYKPNKKPKITADKQQVSQILPHRCTWKVRPSCECLHSLHTSSEVSDYGWVHSSTSVHSSNRSKCCLPQTRCWHWHVHFGRNGRVCFHSHQ